MKNIMEGKQKISRWRVCKNRLLGQIAGLPLPPPFEPFPVHHKGRIANRAVILGWMGGARRGEGAGPVWGALQPSTAGKYDSQEEEPLFPSERMNHVGRGEGEATTESTIWKDAIVLSSGH